MTLWRCSLTWSTLPLQSSATCLQLGQKRKREWCRRRKGELFFMSTLQYLRLSSKPAAKAFSSAKHFNAINLYKSFLRSLSLSVCISVWPSPSLLSVSLVWPRLHSCVTSLSLRATERRPGQHCSSPWIFFFYELSSRQENNINPSADGAMYFSGFVC